MAKSKDRGKGPADQPPQTVGYGKPPVQHRFKPGLSGNPKGRPKGSQNFSTVVLRAIGQKVTVVENGKRVRRRKLEIAITQVVNKAVSGDLKAFQQLMPLVLGTAQAPAPSAELAPDDQEVLNAFLARNGFAAIKQGGTS